MTKKYIVTIPIGGHIVFHIEAETEKQAIDKAYDADPDTGEISWEYMDDLGSGNVCHHPSPWNVEAEEYTD